MRDRIDVTAPGPISPMHWGRSVSGKVPLAGGSWVASLHGAGAEAAETHAAVSEFDYEVFAPAPRWKLERSDSGFIASDRLTGIFGSGPDPNEAIRDLFAALHEHRDVLERQESLSPGLQEQLGYLRELP